MATHTQGNYKAAIGALLAEICKLRTELGKPYPDQAEIFGLQNGIEPVIDEYLRNYDCLITQQQIDMVVRVLDNQNLETFKGYYDIDRELKECGISRAIAHIILTYLMAEGSFRELIKKMDSEHSPFECRNYELPKIGSRERVDDKYPKSISNSGLKWM